MPMCLTYPTLLPADQKAALVVDTIGTPCSLAVPYPQTRTNISPRIDYQLTPNQTLTVRYSYYQDTRNEQRSGKLRAA